MLRLAYRPLLIVLAALPLNTLGAVEPPQSTSAKAPTRPKLLVLVFFDQFRGDYLDRWSAQFGEGGFKRLVDEGASYQNCHYPYALTVTGAGHASVASGRLPSDHGVVGNDWYERAVGKTVNCVGDDRYEQVPPPITTADSKEEKSKTKVGVSPKRLLGPTLADALKSATAGKGKVVSVSLKDRGAVLAGGQTPDACYWMDDVVGQFITSNCYRDAPHPWVAAFNKEKPAEKWVGKSWERFRPDLNYASLSGPDEVTGEGKGSGNQGKVFPHPFGLPDAKSKRAYLGAVCTSPFGNDLVLDFAERAITAEGLGADDVPDLLSMSFSSNDLVGHAWGPDSQEVLDVTLRSDLIMKRLLETLDAKVGKGNYLLVMSADHGICPLPEVSRSQGKDAKRVLPATATKIEDYLAQTYSKKGKSKWIEATSGPWIYLNAKAIKAVGVEPATIERELADWVAKQPGVHATYTRTALIAGIPVGDATGQKVARSFHPDRCGEIYVLLKPLYLPSAELSPGTNHGSPWPYDTHVPLVVFGNGVVPGVRQEPVTPLAAATILAQAANIKLPAAKTAPVPPGLLAAVGK